MTIKKNYSVQVDYEDGRIDHRPVKATSLKLANDMAQEMYSDDNVTYVSVSTAAEYKQCMRSNTKDSEDIFRVNRFSRLGKYIFQHKGRKVKGRKNYPTPRRGWQTPGPRFEFTEKYGVPILNFLQEWIDAIRVHSGIPHL